MAAAAVGIGEGGDALASHGGRGRREPQDGQRARAGRIVVGLLELGETQLDEPGDLVVQP